MSIYSTFDQTELDREYSPSSCIEDINVFLDAYAAVSHSVKDNAIIGEETRAFAHLHPRRLLASIKQE